MHEIRCMKNLHPRESIVARHWEHRAIRLDIQLDIVLLDIASKRQSITVSITVIKFGRCITDSAIQRTVWYNVLFFPVDLSVWIELRVLLERKAGCCSALKGANADILTLIKVNEILFDKVGAKIHTSKTRSARFKIAIYINWN